MNRFFFVVDHRKGDRVGNLQVSDFGAPQTFQMGKAPKFTTDVVSQHTDVGSFTHPDIDFGRLAVKLHQFEMVHMDLSRMTLNLNTASRKIIQIFAVAFDGRVHRRHLFDLAGKFRQKRFKRLARRTHVRRFRHLTGLIHRIGARAEAKHRFIALIGMQKIGRILGCVAESQGQKPCRKGIKGTGMAGFLRIDQAAREL